MISHSHYLLNFVRSIWNLLTELPLRVIYERRQTNNRSIVRAIGTLLPLPPAPRVCFNIAAWNPEVEITTDDSGFEVISPKPPEKSNYQQQIDELQGELKAIKDKLALLLEKESCVKLEMLANSKNVVKIENGVSKDCTLPPVPPPPPPPMPDFNLAAPKPPSFKKNKRSCPRSPGGRPIKPKRDSEIDANDILTQALKKRYAAIQESSDPESFNASFTDITSPIKTAVC